MHTEGALVHLDPARILADDNTRFSILKGDIDVLKASILEMGGVQIPVEVEPLAAVTPEGQTHRLTVGFRRHAAVTELNKEGAGIALPAIVRAIPDPLTRLRHQLSENIDRKNLSPMDTAVALRKLFDAGLSRTDIRAMFPRPTGKNGTPQPASNAWVNMTLSFLDLPAAIRAKIHAGLVGVKAAYELTKVVPEKRQAVLNRAEAERQKDAEKEAADEEKWVSAEAKVAEVTKTLEETETALDNARLEVEACQSALDLAQRAASDAYKRVKTTKEPEAKRVLEKEFKALETEAKAVEKKLVSAMKAQDKLTGAQEKTQGAAKAAREKLEQARKLAPKSKKSAVGEADVKKAAAEEGAGGPVALNRAEMAKVIADLALVEQYPIVAGIGQAIAACFEGSSTPGKMLKTLAVITGEFTAKVKR